MQVGYSIERFEKQTIFAHRIINSFYLRLEELILLYTFNKTNNNE